MTNATKDPEAIKRGYICHGCIQAFHDSGLGLKEFPALLYRICKDKMWQCFYLENIDETVEFESFESFVCEPLPRGLGADMATVKNLCRNNLDVLEEIDRTVQRPVGRPATFNNVQDSAAPVGNSREAALRRLRKDRPDLLKAVIAGEKTCHAAMIEAGFRKRETAADALKRAWDKATAAERSAFLESSGSESAAEAREKPWSVVARKSDMADQIAAERKALDEWSSDMDRRQEALSDERREHRTRLERLLDWQRAAELLPHIGAPVISAVRQVGGDWDYRQVTLVSVGKRTATIEIDGQVVRRPAASLLTMQRYDTLRQRLEGPKVETAQNRDET